MQLRIADLGLRMHRSELPDFDRHGAPFQSAIRNSQSAIRNPQSAIQNPPSGVVLLIVLIVVAMLALGAYSFVQLMNTEARAAQMYGRHVQAREAADSGVHFVAAVLLDQKFAGSLGTDVYDASGMFNGQVVSDESANVPRLRCRFSVVAPIESGGNVGSMRYGVMDEASKINLNTLVQLIEAQGNQAGAGTGGGGGTGSGGGSGATTTNPLLYLPNMTQEIADAILDWLDADDTPRQYGAESDYYRSLNPPYQPRNGPLHSLDELLLVAGVTPRLLYGEDANCNGVLDANEDDGEQSSPNDDANGILDRGWIQYLTLYSHESNTDQLGSPRIYLNNKDLESLYDQLAQDSDFGEEKARFIVAFRLFGAANSAQQGGSQQGQQQSGQSGQQGGQSAQQSGQSTQQGGQQGPSASQSGPPQGQQQSQRSGQPQTGSQSQGQQPSQQQSGDSSSSSSGSSNQKTIAGMDASGGAKYDIQSVLDLVGITVNAKMAGQQDAGQKDGGQQNAGQQNTGQQNTGQQNTTELRSPFQESDYDDFLDSMIDRTTTVEKKDIWGRINVNTAPWPALMSLPGMTEDLGDAIVAARGTSESSNEAMSNLGVAWMLTSGAVTKDQFKKIEPHITGQTQVFRVQSVGYFEEGGPQARVEAVIDLSGSSPRIRFWRDLSSHGRGFDPQVLMRTVGR